MSVCPLCDITYSYYIRSQEFVLDSLSYCHLSNVIEGHDDCPPSDVIISLRDCVSYVSLRYQMVCVSLCVYVLSYCYHLCHYNIMGDCVIIRG